MGGGGGPTQWARQASREREPVSIPPFRLEPLAVASTDRHCRAGSPRSMPCGAFAIHIVVFFPTENAASIAAQGAGGRSPCPPFFLFCLFFVDLSPPQIPALYVTARRWLGHRRPARAQLARTLRPKGGPLPCLRPPTHHREARPRLTVRGGRERGGLRRAVRPRLIAKVRGDQQRPGTDGPMGGRRPHPPPPAPATSSCRSWPGWGTGMSRACRLRA